MNQVSTLLRDTASDSPRSGTGDIAVDPGEDPHSPGPTPSHDFRPERIGEASGGTAPEAALNDPLAQPIAALLGASLALLTLLVPLLAVLNDRRELPAAPQARDGGAPLVLSRSGRPVPGPGGGIPGRP